MNAAEAIRRIREKNGLAPEAPVGLFGCFGRKAEVEGDGRTVSMIATTDDIDLDREVIVPEGLSGERYFFRNRNLFVDHDYSFGAWVAKLRSVSPINAGGRQRGWRVRAVMREGHPIADEILGAIREGMTIGTSIGFLHLEGGKPTAAEAALYAKGDQVPEWIVRKADWLEQSFTAMPCNVSCQTDPEPKTLGGQAAQRAVSELEEWCRKGRISRLTAVALGLPESSQRKLWPVLGTTGDGRKTTSTRPRAVLELSDGSIARAG